MTRKLDHRQKPRKGMNSAAENDKGTGRLLQILHLHSPKPNEPALLSPLMKAGFDLALREAQTPKDLLSALEEQKWHLILADGAPGLDPSDILKLLKTKGIDCPVVILAEKVEPHEGVAAIQAGADDYFARNDSMRLLLAVERCLHGQSNRGIIGRKKSVKEVMDVCEQQRLGQDLHDGLCQQLVGIKLKAALLQEALAEKAPGRAKEAGKIVELLRQAIEETHRVARGLQPVQLEAEGLPFALQELAASTRSLFGVECRFSFRPAAALEDNLAAIHLYRIAQQAVSNAIQHGKASRITIGLGPSAGKILLTITDNGAGFAAANSVQPGLGLSIMKDRARTIGAQLVIRSRPHGGTRVDCILPNRNTLQEQA